MSKKQLKEQLSALLKPLIFQRNTQEIRKKAENIVREFLKRHSHAPTFEVVDISTEEDVSNGIMKFGIIDPSAPIELIIKVGKVKTP